MGLLLMFMRVICVKNTTRLFVVLACKYNFVNRIIQCLKFIYVWRVNNTDKNNKKSHQRRLFPIRNETKCIQLCKNNIFY